MNISARAEVLIDALEPIRSLRQRRLVIKLGGSAMEDPEALHSTLQDVAFLTAIGSPPILVHGGGKPIDRAMEAAGLTPRKVLGRRYTDPQTLEIVVRVLTDEINSSLVRNLRELGTPAVGMYSRDWQCVYGERLTLSDEAGQPVDLGHVGRVTRVEVSLLEQLTRGGIVPLIPSLALDWQGGWLNVNADTVAAAVAVHTRADKVVFMTDTPGVLRDVNDAASLMSRLTASDCRDLIAAGIISGGMIPKVEACLEALAAGARRTQMIDGRVKHSLLCDFVSTQPAGTEIIP